MPYFSPFHFQILLWTSPALILAFIAQTMLRTTYAKGKRVAARMTGFMAARRILDANGLEHIRVEQTPGFLSDHYSPREKVLRLSPEVFQGRTASAVGIAAHEVGHAIQDAVRYTPLVLRNAAVPIAGFGSNAGMLLAMLGLMTSANWLLLTGIILFGAVVVFQVVNLPVEFNASSRAKAQLVELRMLDQDEMRYVRKVLNAAALTYVAATLQAVLTLIYLILRFAARSRRH